MVKLSKTIFLVFGGILIIVGIVVTVGTFYGFIPNESVHYDLLSDKGSHNELILFEDHLYVDDNISITFKNRVSPYIFYSSLSPTVWRHFWVDLQFLIKNSAGEVIRYEEKRLESEETMKVFFPIRNNDEYDFSLQLDWLIADYYIVDFGDGRGGLTHMPSPFYGYWSLDYELKILKPGLNTSFLSLGLILFLIGFLLIIAYSRLKESRKMHKEEAIFGAGTNYINCEYCRHLYDLNKEGRCPNCGGTHRKND